MVPSAPRIAIGVAILLALGGLIAQIALSGDFASGARVALLVVAAGVVLMARTLWLSGRVALELSDGALREAGPDGRVIARVADLRSVDRGAFAFKPSNGFLIRLGRRGSTAWVPGVWWRLGRFVGVGGLVPGHQTKLVAELLSLEMERLWTEPRG